MLNPLQNHLLGMLEWLVGFMEEHNLRYYICGGTMLGAARHGGFIPWDDDIDIDMPRPDYEKLVKLMEKPVGKYVLEAPGTDAKEYPYAFAKIYDTTTTMTERLHRLFTRGVYIDIFPLDGIGNTIEESLKAYKKVDFAHMVLAVKTAPLHKERAAWKQAMIYLSRLIPASVAYLRKKVEQISKERAYEDYKYVGNFTSPYRSKVLMERAIYGTPTEYEFEGIKVKGPEQMERYLQVLYNDWRQLPPEDKRESAHDFVYLDLEHGFLEKQ